MSHLLRSNNCDLCNGRIRGKTFYIHNPVNCAFYHASALEEAKKNHLLLATKITNVTVGGGTLAVAAGRLATVGKVGSMTGKVLGGALAVVGAFTSIVGIVDAATEEAPELPKCSKCGRTEAENPGCILFCNTCGHETDSWMNATEEKHCLQVCGDCCNGMNVCFNCNKRSPSVTSFHRKSNVASVHGTLSTHLYGTCKAARITGDSLSLAGSAVLFVPIIGWIAGPALIVGGIGTNIGAAAASEPTVKVKCSTCNREETPEEFDKVDGCRSMCICCGVAASDKSKFCVRLCETCKKESIDDIC